MSKKYGKCLRYSRKLFYYSSCDDPIATEWFRERKWEEGGELDKVVYAISYKLEKINTPSA
jgi:hypothetical protein